MDHRLIAASFLIVLSLAGAAATPEFDGQCVMGLAGGRSEPTDCTTNWKDQDGKTYCFGSRAQLDAFLQDPGANLRKAREFFAVRDPEATGAAMARYDGEAVKAFVEDAIRKHSASSNGQFRFHDIPTGRELALTFEKIDFMRTLHGYGFFPEAVFHDPSDEAKKYLIDFWVVPAADGLRILDSRIYKAPKKEGDQWVLKARSPKPWWWIPASEHPGEMEEKRGWEIMSAIEQHIVNSRKGPDMTYQLKDDQTGEVLELEFVGTHQPVRRLSEDGRYFACTDFRRKGSRDEYYDIDFWLNDRNGRIEVGDVRVHKVPVLEDGSWIQIPRYQFDGLKFDVIP